MTALRQSRWTKTLARAASGSSRSAEKRDALAAFQLIELHLIPASQGRIAGYRIGDDQSAT
jgi:hypothetical protein